MAMSSMVAAMQDLQPTRGPTSRFSPGPRSTNFVEADVRPGSADLVLCLSVAKWIHINFGDAGLTAAFQKMVDALVPVRCRA